MKKLLAPALALLLPGAAARAQVISPGLTGFNRLTLPGNSDSLLSLPFARPEAAAGLVASVSGSQVTFQGSPGWQANQFVHGGAQPNTYYLRVASGALEGAFFTVTANTATSVAVDLAGGALTGLAAQDRVVIVPYWTLATLFPGGAGIHPATTPGDRLTEVLFPDHNATGTNAGAARIFYLYQGVWQEVGQGATAKDDEILPPDLMFDVRHNVAAGTEWVSSGSILMGKFQLVLGVNATGARDNYLGLQRPCAVTLGASGLVASGAFQASPSPGQRTDELLVFDNQLARQNKSASAIYYYWNNAWRQVGAGAAVFDAAPVLTPGAGFVIRKSPTATAPVWSNAPGY